MDRIIESLEPDIVSSIQKLFMEGERIRNKFDNELKRELKTTIVGIEDGYFAGKCDYERNLPKRVNRSRMSRLFTVEICPVDLTES